MADNTNIHFPDVKIALKDLEEFESKYHACVAKLKEQVAKVEKHKMKKKSLQRDIEDQKNKIEYYEKIYAETGSRIQNAIVGQNKGKLVANSTKEKIKQTETCNRTKLNLDYASDMKPELKSSLYNLKEDLEREVEELDKAENCIGSDFNLSTVI